MLFRLIRVEIRRINVCAHFNRLAVSQQDDVAEAVVVHMVAGQILFALYAAIKFHISHTDAAPGIST